jgi:hypothetical protein
MTTTQIQTLRKLRSDRKRATDAYHACLQGQASAADRHAAESACSATMAALKAFMASLSL